MKKLICKQTLNYSHPLQSASIAKTDGNGLEYVEIEYDSVRSTDAISAGRRIDDGREVLKYYQEYLKDGAVILSEKILEVL